MKIHKEMDHELISVFSELLGITYFVIDKNGNRVIQNNVLRELRKDKPISKEAFKTCQEVMDSGNTMKFEEYDEKTGRWFLSIKTPFRNEKGEIDGAIGLAIDITDKKIKEIELEKALKEKEIAEIRLSNFLSTVSHEINNFVGLIPAMLSFINKEKLDKESIEYLELCKTSSLAVIPFMEDVTKLYKIHGAEFKTKVKEGSIVETVSSVVSEYNEAYKDIEVFYIFDKNMNKPVILDHVNLYRILDIVIGNAFRFTKSDKRIFITLKISENNDLLIKVEDKGIGIEEERLKNIFNAFPDQKDMAVRFQSFGLKLSIAYKLANLVGGDIKINSKVSEGTTVLIKLPLTNKNDTRLSEVRSNKELTFTERETDISKYKDYKILVVEDDFHIRKVIINCLKKLNFRFIDETDSGQKAIELAAKNNYNLIFMDITLIGMSGIESTYLINKDRDKKIPVAAVTSHLSNESEQYFLENGFFYVIPKPISIEKFILFFEEFEGILNGM